MSSTVSLDFQYTTTIEKLWAVLTDSDTLAKWVMKNDFEPVVGHRFQFQSQPYGDWNGIIDCEVLIVDEPNKLSYTWASLGENNTVTWTLQDLGDGKVSLHLEQSGITNPQAQAGAKYGWTNMCGQLEKLLEQ